MQPSFRSLTGKIIPGLLAVILTACAFPSDLPATPQIYLPRPTQKAILIGAPLDATPTPTAFQPIPPTITNTPLPLPTLTLTPTPTQSLFNLIPDAPTIWDDIIGENSPLPAPLFFKPPNQFTILLMGSDQRPDDTQYRTDVMMLLVINQELKTVSLVSFPRDLYVTIPGWRMDRINTTQAKGGFELTAQTLEYNFGIRPDHYALIRFDGFQAIIDSLGGIDVQVEKELADQRTGRGWFTVSPGAVHMNGEMALWYVRSRYTTDDFDRGRRQQEVLVGLFNRLLSLDVLLKIPDLYNQVQTIIKTDLTLDDIISLAKIAPDFSNLSRIRQYAISREHVYPYLHPYTGAAVLLPYQEPILTIFEQALNIPLYDDQ